MTRRVALSLLLISGLVWSLGGVLIKWIPLGGLALAGWRSLVAALIVWAFRGFRISLPRDWITVAGSLAFASNTILFVSATKLTTAANAIVLQYTAPIYVLIFSFAFLGERIGSRDILAVGATMIGLVLMVCDQLSPQGMQGNLLAMGAGLSFGMTILLLRRQAKADPYQIVFYGNLLASFFVLPKMIHDVPAWSDLPALILLGAVFGGGYLLYTAGIKRVRATTGVLMAAIEPLLNPVWVWLVLGEVPGALGLVGGLLVLTAMTSRALFRSES